ncbi:hypothetical protein [Sinisalibacter aestuarii]|uniref:Uncharacterized protein n=1 Tax=Sinisalibacter aestuarii TaxID=2949426 RepID=A0ABQ5LWQ9_9RHOB|nr:hypothetical protein [Sinisalibacter aestuarii]GKY89203.1 hypothetical protein STA1M1_30720 [Sinisalibacter aestuarii]
MTNLAFGLTALAVLGLLLFTPFSRSPLWRATVTPLASIIGSGFLVSAPLLAREFGGYAAPAMALLIVTAWALGWTIRYNIRVVEPLLKEGGDKLLSSVEEISHLVLTFAYFVSVAYYLALLGQFLLASVGHPSDTIARAIAIALVVGLALLGWTGGAARVARLERYATALNLAVISGFLVALALHGAGLISAGQSVLPPAGKASLASLPVLLGLLIVVQGFETTRFTGADFPAATRIKAMRYAQIVSGLVYVIFFLLLSPLYGDLARGSGVAEVITVSALVAPALPLSLAVAAMGSQLSASVADSLGNVGLIREITHGKIDARHGYTLVGLIGTGILIATEVTGVIALASRAFALFYALQALVAFEAARKRPGETARSVAFLALAMLAAAVFFFGTPAG